MAPGESRDGEAQTGGSGPAESSDAKWQVAEVSTGSAIDASAMTGGRAAVPGEARTDRARPAEPTKPERQGEAEDGHGTERPLPSGIWSRQTIEARANTHKLFCDEQDESLFDERRLDPASYRLAVGGEIYISPAKTKDKASVTFLEPREAFFIPPGQFAFLLSEEVVRVPAEAFALIALRTRTKFKGLVNVSGFHADPGYHGRLIFAVFNAGPGDVHLRRGDDLFTISFAWLDEKTVKPRREEERFLHIPSEIITPIAGEVQSLAGLKESIDEVEDELDDRLQAVEREVAILRWALALAFSIVVGLLVRSLS